MSDLIFPAKVLHLSVRDFAVPCPRKGSIDSYSGYGKSSSEGIEIHQQIQARRKREDETYESEVKISHRFVVGEYGVVVDGRIDGLFRREMPLLEEIKSTFNIRELRKVLEDQGHEHPYVLQLMTYGYFYWKENSVLPELTLHLVSTRNGETADLTYRLDLAEYEEWLDRRLAELEVEAQKMEKRYQRRRALEKNFEFPFPKPRNGQRELIKTVQSSMDDQMRLMVQAPTGLGKTAGILYPVLKEAFSRGQRAIYVTPKNSQHSVAEDAVDRFKESGSRVKALSMTAKSKICMKAEPLCNPRYCEYAKDYYEKVHANGVLDILGKKRRLSAKVFKKLAEEYTVCPFELQLDASPDVDLVICDYNYVFAPRSAFGRLPQITFEAGNESGQQGLPNLVIDEAHNLPARAMDYYSPSLSSSLLEKIREDLMELPKRFASDAASLVDECLATLEKLRPPGPAKPAEILLPVDSFLERDGELRSFLTSYLESDVEIQPMDPVLRLVFYWGAFTEILQQISESPSPQFFTFFQPEAGGVSVKISCCDASEMIRKNYEAYQNIVAFSATLKPFDFYARLSGLNDEKLRVAEFQTPFEITQRKLLIIPQISTKYSDRERNYARISDAISRVIQLKAGNYVAFFPSFDFLERVIGIFRAPPGFRVLQQRRRMKAPEIEDHLEGLKRSDEPTILFAVQGGVFSEGVDYPGDMLIGAFVIGPPLPNFDIERETMRKYYSEKYKEGFEYAYTYPAMAKAVQSAGRVIRSETDRGVIILMDNRFLAPGYSKSMPKDWFDASPDELVSRSILKDISEFWAVSER